MGSLIGKLYRLDTIKESVTLAVRGLTYGINVWDTLVEAVLNHYAVNI